MKLTRILTTTGLGLIVAFGLSLNAIADEHEGGEADVSDAIETGGGEGPGVEENGTDPRDLAAKAMPYYRFNKIENGLKSHELTAFGMVPIPFGELVGQPEYQWGLTFEFPALKYVDASAPIDAVGRRIQAAGGPGALRSVPIGTSQGITSPIPTSRPDDKVWGIGDLNTRLIVPAWQGKVGDLGIAFLTGAEHWWKTASHELLGTGKWQIAPMGVVVVDFAPGMFLASMNFWRTSYAGDGDREDIELYVGRHFLNIPFGDSGFYTLTELQTICDLRDNNDWEVWIGPEFGKVLAPGRILYAKPGFGISADDDEREWSFEVGYRHFF